MTTTAEDLRATEAGEVIPLSLSNGERVLLRRTKGSGRHEWMPLPGQGISSEALAEVSQ